MATTAAIIETENNASRRVRLRNGETGVIADPGDPNGATVAEILNRYPPGDPRRGGLQPFINAYGTSDPIELQAIVNLLGQGVSETDVRAAQAAANAAHGAGTTAAAQALVAVSNGTTTTAALQAQGDANRVTVSSSGIFNNSLLNSSLLGSNPFLTCVTCTVDAQGNLRFLTAAELLAGGRTLLNNLGERIAYIDANYGRVVTRGLGVLQAGAGVFDVIVGGSTAIVAGAACPVTGVSCFVAAGGGAVGLIGFDNIQAGSRTALFGEYTPTFGANRISDLTGISVENADLLYGFSTFGIGTAQGAVRRLTLRGVANAEADAALAAARAEAARTGDSLAARADAEAGTNQVVGALARQATPAPTFRSSSGIEIAPTPGRTTTILGSFGSDLDQVINSTLNAPRTVDFGANPGGYNVLNVPDSFYQNADQFFRQYNQPFLDAAIRRGDEIILATPPNATNLTRTLPGNINTRTGFGREYDYLRARGYTYDAITSKMIPPRRR